MNVGFLAPQADGLGVGDEMNLVAALRKFQAEFRSHNAAAAVGRITRDPNLHSAMPALSGLVFDGRKRYKMQILQGSAFRRLQKVILRGEHALRFSVSAW